LAFFAQCQIPEEGAVLAPAALACWQHGSQMGEQSSKYWESLSPTSASPGLRHFFCSLTTCTYTAPVSKYKGNTSKGKCHCNLEKR